MTSSLAISGLVFFLVTFHPDRLPATFVPGVGLTAFKRVFEYAIICLLILSIAAYWRRFSRTRDRLLAYYMAAFSLCCFSELVFTVYKSVFDTYNVLGHAYKTVAFYLVYRGVFIASVQHPYRALVEKNEALGREIAERTTAEQQLRISENRYRRLFRSCAPRCQFARQQISAISPIARDAAIPGPASGTTAALTEVRRQETLPGDPARRP